MSNPTVNVAEYLYIRLRQLGCLSLHGLPGDFNLVALDYVVPSGLTWVGSCNELNASYAADAYARVRGLGAVMTTFGVGELSAVNGIAGSYAELAPVVHIVGTPSRASQTDGAFLHHTLGNGDFKVFAQIFSHITIAQANLFDPRTAPAEIDRVLQACFVESRPVYIQLPTDMVTQSVDARLLDTPIDLVPHQSDKAAEDMALRVILEHLYAAKSPVILVDGAVQRRGLTAAAQRLVSQVKIPVVVAPMGKGIIDESLDTFLGVYAGDGSEPEVRNVVDTSDLVLTIGNIKSDLNTAGFTYRFSKLNTIDLHYNHVDVGYASFAKVFLKSLLPRITETIDASKLQSSATHFTRIAEKKLKTIAETDGDVITHRWLWRRMSSFLREGDLVVTETGTSYVGCREISLPKDVQIINQILWSSIGYGVGAAQGAALAAKDTNKGQRTICFEGDGSFQLTAQELSTIMRHSLNVTMFLINNEGYTIERYIHGLEAHYNDIAAWQYSRIPEVLTSGKGDAKFKTWRISSRREFDQLLNDNQFATGKGLQFVEILMPKLDAPEALIKYGEAAAAHPS